MNKPQLSAADLSALTKAMAAFGAEAQKMVDTITITFKSAMLDPQQVQEIKELAKKLQIIRDLKSR
jgi:hypothetical protein